MKIIIIGGVAGGATAAARLRRLDENAEIILFEKGAYVSFANCGLPYYIGGKISDREALFVSDKHTISSRYNIDIRDNTEIISIDKENKLVTAGNLQSGEKYTESYDKLLLSTGSTPFVPDIEGRDFENVFTLWTIPDTDRIYDYIRTNSPKKAVVVGGGFIGLEMVENLSRRGIEVTLVEKANQVMPPIDKDMARIIENHMRSKGVRLLLEKGLSKIIDNGRTVVLDDGSNIPSDMTVLAIGVRPNSGLAKNAGILVNSRGGIIVDEYSQSSEPDIYAVGDVIEVENYITGAESMIPLAGPANKQGRAVAASILDKKLKESYRGTIGTSIAKVFDMTIAGTGLNEKMLAADHKEYGKDYFVALVHPMSHAGYYPNAMPMTVKLIFGSDKKVLGAQIVGYDGVDKRIDTISACIHFKGDIYDLASLELAYAPPYSSAKDPVNFAGYVAANIYEGLSTPIRYQDYIKDPASYILIDVRESIEHMAARIKGSVNIPLSVLRSEISRLDPSKTYVVHCAVGLRGYIAERILKQKGFKVYNMMGGFRTYSEINADLTPQGSSADTEQSKAF